MDPKMELKKINEVLGHNMDMIVMIGVDHDRNKIHKIIHGNKLELTNLVTNLLINVPEIGAPAVKMALAEAFKGYKEGGTPVLWLSLKRWPARSILSTSVVLPWSTWAMIAMLRMFCIDSAFATLKVQSYKKYVI